MRVFGVIRESGKAHCRAFQRVVKTHKGAFHLSLIGFIGWNLMHEAAGMADWAFVVLALLCEMDGGGQ